jgi:hypothetical protein
VYAETVEQAKLKKTHAGYFALRNGRALSWGRPFPAPARRREALAPDTPGAH